MKETLKRYLPGFMYSGLRGLRDLGVYSGKQSVLFSKWLNRKRIRLGNSLIGGLPIPPADLIFLVAGGRDPGWFLKSGKLGQQCLIDTLAKNNIQLEDKKTILDFGCGVGRVIRHFKSYPHLTIHGTDYNPDLVNWCRGHLPFADFAVNSSQGKLEYEDDTFDFTYALSLFTHLTGEQQDFWIKELTRVVRPGGYLFITVHGEYYIPDVLEQDREKYRAGEMLFYGGQVAGTNWCNAFHPPSYMRQFFAPHLELVDHIPEGALGNPRQDVYLFRKPPVGTEADAKAGK